MSGPAFSVIIPAYNEAELVGSAIHSVLRQSREDWEMIVVDDGSTDDTTEAVRSFEREDPRINLLRKPNEGLSAARNTGIEAAAGRYLSFLDSDDLWLPRYLAAMGSALEADPEAGLAYTDAWALDAGTHRIRRATAMAPWHPPTAPPRDPLETLRSMVRGNFMFVSTTVPSAVLDDVGGFDTSLSSSEDYDLWLRILASGYRAVSPEGVLAIKRERPTAMSVNHMKMLTNQAKVIRKLASDASLPADIRETAESRAAGFDRVAGALSGRDKLGAAVIALRRILSPLRSAVQPSRRWRRRPPAEVETAFPDLEGL